jgi:hypothetical protein
MLSVTVAHLPPNTALASTGARDEEMRAEVIWFDTGGVLLRLLLYVTWDPAVHGYRAPRLLPH